MSGEGGSGNWADGLQRVALEVKAIRYGFGCWVGFWSYAADGDGARLWMVANIRVTRRRALRSARRAYARDARPFCARPAKADQGGVA